MLCSLQQGLHNFSFNVWINSRRFCLIDLLFPNKKVVVCQIGNDGLGQAGGAGELTRYDVKI